MNKLPLDIFVQDGILYGKGGNAPFVLDLQMAKQILDQRLLVSQGNSYPILIDYTKIQYATKEARLFFAGKEGEQGVIAVAFITPNIISRVLVNSYLVMHRPNIPTKLFLDEASAVRWLKQYIQT